MLDFRKKFPNLFIVSRSVSLTENADFWADPSKFSASAAVKPKSLIRQELKSGHGSVTSWVNFTGKKNTETGRWTDLVSRFIHELGHHKVFDIRTAGIQTPNSLGSQHSTSIQQKCQVHAYEAAAFVLVGARWSKQRFVVPNYIQQLSRDDVMSFDICHNSSIFIILG